jgi:hypothetical protein
MKVEYKVREIKRYIVTRYEESDDSKSGSCTQRGEFDNFDTAYHVGYAMAKLEHEKLGYPPGDMRVIYPESESPTSHEKLINHMVNKFLGWKLPNDFLPDAGISFTPYKSQTMNDLHWPSGTNLLNATQAKLMFEHCMEK